MWGVGRDLLVEVGTRLRAMREARGLSQEALAERASLHRNYVGSVERGERDIGLTSLAGILRGLGSSLPEFFASLPVVRKPRR